MSWEEDLFALLDDLEQQAERLYDAERGAELADRSRSAYQHVTLASRLMASVGLDVTLGVRRVGAVAGRLERVATGWCVVRGPSQDWIIRLDVVDSVHGASARSLPELAWSPLTRLGFGSALRGLSESGQRCVLHLLDGARYDGVLARVGSDFVEASVAPDRTLLVAFAGLAAVQSHD